MLPAHVGIASKKGLVTGGLPPSFPELASYKCRQSCLDIPQPSAPSCTTLQRTSPAKMFSKLVVLVLAAVPAAFSVNVRQTTGFVNPANGGGSMLIDAGNGLGEPLNVRIRHAAVSPQCLTEAISAQVIISGQSSQSVLNEAGITNYARAIGL